MLLASGTTISFPLLHSVWETGTTRWTAQSSIAEIHTGHPSSGWGIGEVADQVTLARSHWSGMIAQIVLNASVAEAQTATADQTGLSRTVRSTLERILSGSSRHTEYVQVLVAERLYPFFAADRKWCLEWVLPLLDPTEDQDRAIRCWNGYLPLGRFTLELLEAGLLDHYVRIAELLNRFTSETQRAYHAHLTLIVRVFGPDVGSGWLKRFTNTADTDTRVQWIRSVASNFAALPVEDVEAQWEAWMRTYWKNRLRSIPVAMTRDEASAMAEWTVTLDHSFRQAVHLAVQHDASLDEHSRVLFRLDMSAEAQDNHPRPDYLTEYPQDVATLLTHLLTHTKKAPTTGSYHTGRIIQKLRPHVTEQQHTALLNKSISLGLVTATHVM